ncbi:hypothetical protein LINGRAHAP2_LOCUS24836, partial [Linum grandiflorum]
ICCHPCLWQADAAAGFVHYLYDRERAELELRIAIEGCWLANSSIPYKISQINRPQWVKNFYDNVLIGARNFNRGIRLLIFIRSTLMHTRDVDAMYSGVEEDEIYSEVDAMYSEKENE